VCLGSASSRRLPCGDSPERRLRPHASSWVPRYRSLLCFGWTWQIFLRSILTKVRKNGGAKTRSGCLWRWPRSKGGPYICRQDAQDTAQTCPHRHHLQHCPATKFTPAATTAQLSTTSPTEWRLVPSLPSIIFTRLSLPQSELTSRHHDVSSSP
jgi:hypothetical protein